MESPDREGRGPPKSWKRHETGQGRPQPSFFLDVSGSEIPSLIVGEQSQLGVRME